ncbi:MAG: type 1 glutamine amidotransferase [Pseudomonadota bacterium]
MQIGILQAGHTPEELRATRGDFDTMFARLLDGHGFTFRAYDVEHMAFPDDVRDCDGWLVTGSRHGAYEDHPFIPPLEAFIRDAHTADIPLVGICFGHQIVAQALGGTVVKWPGGWSIGYREYRTTDGARFALNAWHQDQVTVLPDGATTLAANEFCAHAVVAYGRRAFTLQPHPEFASDLIGEYVTMRRGTGTYPDDRMDAAVATLDRPVDDARVAAAIARFFKTRAAHV